MILTYTLFVVGFIILVKGADWLVDSAMQIARKYRISELVIGLTVVAFGTSAPELFVNLYATAKGDTDIAIGNIIGSNIANIFLILGVAAIIGPLTVHRRTVMYEIPISLVAAILAMGLAIDWFMGANHFTFLSGIDGMVLLICFVLFMMYAFRSMRTEPSADDVTEPTESMVKAASMLLLGLGMLMLGSKWIVDGAIAISRQMNIDENVVALTVVAIGTSLPELATSAMAAYKKQSDIAIGNVVGSNIFNTFLILGTSAAVRPLPFTPANMPDLIVNIAASALLLFILVLSRPHTMTRSHGFLFLGFYICYVWFLLGYH